MGMRIPYSNGRRLVGDLMRMANRFPSAGIASDFDVQEINRLRRLVRPKISWDVLYMKAYSIVAQQIPELRQFTVGFPREHLYQHDDNVCMLTLSREYQGEQRLLFARFSNPQFFSLANLQARYHHLRHAPIDEIRQFRHQIQFAKIPGLIRRLAWWVMFNAWPGKRASHVGTFGMSVSGYRGAYGTTHLGPLTTILGVDPLPKNGNSRITLTFDHRVLDGLPATNVLHRLQQVMKREILNELNQMHESNTTQTKLAKAG